jgi:enterochelin esterase-like enzyme
MGSSLGGVAAFYLGWQYPETFVGAACMSSTFGNRDDLLERVYSEPRRPVAFFLDSGWPGDNYEATLVMATALVQRGYRLGAEVHHISYPLQGHDEVAWGMRMHIPAEIFARSLSVNTPTHGSIVDRLET